MPLKVDTRAQLNIKGARINVDFLTLLKKAAERQGQTVTDFIVDSLTREAQRVVKVEPAPTAAVPARLEDVVDKLAAAMADERAQLAAEMRQGQAELRRVARRGRWWR